MATTFTGALNGQTVKPAVRPHDPYVISNIVDLSDDTVFTTAPTGATSDIIQCLSLPAKTAILRAGLIVHTVEGATAAGTLGVTGGTTNGFATAVDLNSLTNTPYDAAAAYNAAGGLYLASADTIDLAVSTSASYDAAKFEVWALCMDMTASV